MKDMQVFENSFNIETIKDVLLKEFKAQYKNGLYAKTQKMLAYNSNHMEGSTLSEEQTASLFDTGTIYGDEVYRAQDIEEAQGHFLMFNEMLKTIEQPLDTSLIKKFHYCLKSGVFIDRANGYAIGDYKTRPNIAGTKETVLPNDVPVAMETLVEQYNKMGNKNIENLTKFHADFEHIHPFQDGNGRVGRLLLFREALVNDIMPPIILDTEHTKYIFAIKKAHDGELSELINIVTDAQKVYFDTVKYFIV